MAKYKIGDKVLSNERGLPVLWESKFQNCILTITEVYHDGYRIDGAAKDGSSLKGCYTTDAYISHAITEAPSRIKQEVKPLTRQRANYRLNRKILAHLRSGKSISPVEALVVHGCLRLAAAICDLRQAGHNIKTDIHHDSNGKQYARYSLIKDERIAA